MRRRADACAPVREARTRAVDDRGCVRGVPLCARGGVRGRGARGQVGRPSRMSDPNLGAHSTRTSTLLELLSVAQKRLQLHGNDYKAVVQCNLNVSEVAFLLQLHFM